MDEPLVRPALFIEPLTALRAFDADPAAVLFDSVPGTGGRHAYLCAGSLPDVDALVDCWGGNKFADNKNNPAKRPVPPIELTEKITAPVLGIYGNDDKNPSPEDVNKTEERLKKAGKKYEFHRYDGAGHGFFNAPRPAYRPEQAQDAWKKVFAFFEKHLSR